MIVCVNVPVPSPKNVSNRPDDIETAKSSNASALMRSVATPRGDGPTISVTVAAKQTCPASISPLPHSGTGLSVVESEKSVDPDAVTGSVVGARVVEPSVTVAVGPLELSDELAVGFVPVALGSVIETAVVEPSEDVPLSVGGSSGLKQPTTPTTATSQPNLMRGSIPQALGERVVRVWPLPSSMRLEDQGTVEKRTADDRLLPTPHKQLETLRARWVPT